MSRSNPTDNSPNPATRWFEWDGSNGVVRYYDKTEKKNILVPDGFAFLLLDELATVKGWHDDSESGIYSNEVRDTKQEVFVVKAFMSKMLLAEGLYSQIRDRVASLGGSFTANCYIAFKDGTKLAIGSLQFKGAALNAWVDFRKAHRADLYSKAIRIKGFVEGKKGTITFRKPIFHLVDSTEQTNAEALALDATLQAFLKEYLKRTRIEQVDQTPPPQPEAEYDESRGYHLSRRQPEPVHELEPQPADEDDIPF